MSWLFKSKLADSIAVTAVSGNTALPAFPAANAGGAVAWLCNTGSKDAWVNFGASGLVATVAGGAFLGAKTCRAFSLQFTAAGGYVAAICGGSDTTTITVEIGSGDPAPVPISVPA